MSGDKSKTTTFIVARYAVSCMRDEGGYEIDEETVEVTLSVEMNVECHDTGASNLTDDQLAEWEEFFKGREA